MIKLGNPFSTIEDSDVTEVVRRLVAELGPQAIYLFGSQVVGVPGRDSDLDLMVIVINVATAQELNRRGYACLRGIDVPVELHFSSQTRFNRFADVFGSLQYDIKHKGVLVHAA